MASLRHHRTGEQSKPRVCRQLHLPHAKEIKQAVQEKMACRGEEEDKSSVHLRQFNFGGPIRGVSLHPRGSLPVTDFPGWDDEEEVECSPLFGRHCGGVWNTIIEESS